MTILKLLGAGCFGLAATFLGTTETATKSSSPAPVASKRTSSITVENQSLQLATKTRHVDFWNALDDDQISTRLIAKSSRSINLLITNVSDDTLVIAPPKEFGAVHVLAQRNQPGGQFGGGQFGGGPFGGGPFGGGQFGGGQFPGGAGPGQGFGAGAGMGGGQALGGGFGIGGGPGAQFGGQNGGNFGPIGGGGFRVRDDSSKNGTTPNKTLRPTIDQRAWLIEAGDTRRFTANTVCLDYGKPDPTPRMHYKIVRLKNLGRGEDVSRIVKALANSQIGQPVAQALAWHATTDMNWKEISRINRVESRYTGSIRYFRPTTIRQAMTLASHFGGDSVDGNESSASRGSE
ncbi:MAG TPA: hypothetical protein DDW52_03320 [Planctomycetaceae bacterium]|nr:hypothetical protein [Planctomycetaceae bacterium]